LRPTVRAALKVACALHNELFFRLDGSSFPVEYRVGPILRDGQLQGAVCTFVDISEPRDAQEQQSLLLRELNNRVKNLFAVTSSMIALSARSAKTPKELASNIRGRLDALARAHELVLLRASGQTDSNDESTSLDILLQKILSPYLGSLEEPGRLVMSGPPVLIGTNAVTRFALILHELATNAAKYGVLSVPEGSVHIRWSSQDDVLVMNWEQRGGPTLIGAPMAEGFGTVLCKHSIHGQFTAPFPTTRPALLWTLRYRGNDCVSERLPPARSAAGAHFVQSLAHSYCRR
jgi:two-component system CheB/CheR fusion protein